MKISIVIPNFNGAQLLTENIPTIIIAANYFSEKTEEKYEVIVVDDGSTDISQEVLRDIKTSLEKQNIRFSYFVHSHNMGFSSAVNTGVQKANGEFVVLLNTDVRPEREFLLPLVPHFDNPTVFAVGCMDKTVELGKNVFRGRGIGAMQKGFLLHSAGALDKKKTLWASGGSSIYRRSIWEKLGGMDTLYNPFYWEDIDLSYRAWKSGFEVHFESKSIVLHEHEKGAIKMYQIEKRVTTTAYRNQFIFFWKNITDPLAILMHFFWLPFHIVRTLLSGDVLLLFGFLAAVQRLPTIMVSQRKARKLFVRTDAAVLQEVQI